MGSSLYLRLNILICGINQNNEELINRLFPEQLEDNKRKLYRKKDNVLYTARIFRGEATSIDNLNRMKNYINQNFDHIQNEKNVFPKNVLLYFSNENETLQQSSEKWKTIANHINTLPELKLPFIVFLSYGNIEDIQNQIQNDDGDIFDDFQDKRKITILRLLKNENGGNIQNNNEENENQINENKINENNNEINYRKILSYLWNLTLILNQQPFKLSKVPEANFFKIKEEIPSSSINVLLTGFSRKGKSTFINMIFDKMVTLENPSFIPVTSEIIEFLLPSEPDQNGIVKGGIKLFDVPGLIEGTTQNMSRIVELIDKSVENLNRSYDIINYVLFFLSPSPNFQNTKDFLKKLNGSKIKVIFIINRDQPKNNGRANVTKSTLISHLQGLGLNNLIKDNGNNILEVDLIKGVEGRTNEIFRYIHNDLLENNRFDDNVINRVNNLPEEELYPYLHDNFEFFSEISSREDLINRGLVKADLIIAGTIPVIIAAGFSPIPFIDIPIFLFLTALMLISIFKAFGFTIDISIFRNFFDTLHSAANGENNNNNEQGLIARVFIWLNRNLGNINNDNTKFIIKKLIEVLKIRIGISALCGLLDLIPGGFIIKGIVNAVINSDFIYKIGDEAKKFLSDKINKSGGRQNILNLIEGYRDSISLIKSLRDKNDWARKIQILNN